jgi:DNA-binding Lrp family transcriptional regulator
MPKAYILLTVESGYEEQVKQIVKDTEGVQEVYVSYGVYDLIVKVTAGSMEELKKLITYRLRPIKNVQTTLTLILTDD